MATRFPASPPSWDRFTTWDSLAELLGQTVDYLGARGAPDEALAVLRPSRGFAVFRTAPVMRPAGRAWRLGVLLLDRKRGLSETGEVTRAIEPGVAAINRSKEGEQRREFRRAASRGPFSAGEVVNWGFSAISTGREELEAGSGPLSLDGDTVMVQWNPAVGAGGKSVLAFYLADRSSLLSGE